MRSIAKKRLKKWRRAWKLELIERDHPQWRDLYDHAPCLCRGQALGPGLRGDDGRAEVRYANFRNEVLAGPQRLAQHRGVAAPPSTSGAALSRGFEAAQARGGLN